MIYRIGLDIGSTTAKMVVADGDGRIVWSRYERHNARVKEILLRFFADAEEKVGSRHVTVAVTGSVGMQTAEVLGAEFVQEVVAASFFARQQFPEAKTLIDIGGEDSKVVLFNDGRLDLRMNGNCAGGTGAFIDQMAQLLGLTNLQMNDLALTATHHHTIAARCGVFAKTDVQNLMSRGVPVADICASVFHSIAVQTITTLAHGQTIEPPILLCGGPLTFLSALRKAFADYMHWDESLFIVGQDNCLVPAIGCTLRCKDATFTLSELKERLSAKQQINIKTALQPLFVDEDAVATWQQEKRNNAIEVEPMQSREQVVIGIDSGSTTTKIVAARSSGEILFTYYTQSLGKPIEAVREGLRQLQMEAQRQCCGLSVVGSCSTGYGEDLIKAAFSLDDGIIETMAHYQAARRLMPDVSFILDIGGQDMKAIFVEKGVVTRMELNEACSSGCGTFLQTFAQSLGIDISEFARQACTAVHPCDLGTRCTVFMNSKIKQVLREGACVADIAAGLAYSVVNNCLHKVLKLKNVSELGRRIVVQGGTMRNDAVVRALELLTGCQVARSNMPEMMGAYGCALHAARHLSAPRSLEQMMQSANCETRLLQCRGCENACQVTRHKFAGGSSYHSGNKCERVFTNTATTCQPGGNVYPEKLRMLFDRETNAAALRRIGIPRVLNMYEDYPFWHRLLTYCGFQVVLSSESKMQRYEGALCMVMSDNICFPAKLVHSHIEELQNSGVERILMPYVVFDKQESLTAVNSYNCPIVSGYSDVIRSSMSSAVPVDSPVINFADSRLLKKQVVDYLWSLGISPKIANKAFSQALQAQEDYETSIQELTQKILDEGRRKQQMIVLLAGRPYHADPLIQHRLSETISQMGACVISEDIVRNRQDIADGHTNSVRQWAYTNRIIKAAQWVSSVATDVQFVQMTSFGCGPDAFIQDEVRSLLARHHKTYTLLKIDDVSNIGSLKLRVRSLIESLRLQSGRDNPIVLPFQTTRTYTRNDRRRKILVPHISEFITPLLPAFGHVAGYDIEVLPPSDAESAAVGLQYANNEVCYPAMLIVGDIIKALQSGRYHPEEIAVAMSQTGGQCRATNYAGLIKRAMVQAGFQQIPLITLGVTTNETKANQQEGFDVPWLRLFPVLATGLLYADAVAKMYYSTVCREKQAGTADVLRDKYLRLASEVIRKHDTKQLMLLIDQAASEFNAACTDRKTKRVGIVGEIFLKFNHFAHQQITDVLINQGFEVVPPLITPFFLQEFVNVVQNKRLGLSASHLPSVVVRMLYRLAWRHIQRFNSVLSRYPQFTPFTDIRREARLAFHIVSPAAQAGEGWLLPGDMMELAEQGVNSVISLQPFGCIANHIVAKGIEKAVLRHYPHLNLLSLDFDSGVSSVNVINRLLLFLDSA